MMQYNVCVEIYFLFLISLCVFVLVATVCVLRLHLRAETQHPVAMQDWVRGHRKNFSFLQRVRMARNAVRCTSQSILSVRLSVFPSFRHTPLLCPDE